MRGGAAAEPCFFGQHLVFYIVYDSNQIFIYRAAKLNWQEFKFQKLHQDKFIYLNH